MATAGGLRPLVGATATLAAGGVAAPAPVALCCAHYDSTLLLSVVRLSVVPLCGIPVKVILVPAAALLPVIAALEHHAASGAASALEHSMLPYFCSPGGSLAGGCEVAARLFAVDVTSAWGWLAADARRAWPPPENTLTKWFHPQPGHTSTT